MPPTRTPRIRRFVLLAALLVATPYLAAAGYLKLSELELVFRHGISRERIAPALPVRVEEIAISTDGGAQLAAVVIRHPDAATGRWILHLHGNADSAFSTMQVAHVQALAALGWSVLAPDPRGMGKTPGVPSEPGFHADAEAALRWLAAAGVPPGRVLVWGHSLGSGPAVELAAHHSVAGLVLFGAFTSVPDRGAELYPWLPVHWIASVRFDNLTRIRDVHVPVVIAHAVTDVTIPYAHSERLYAAANEPKQLLRLEARSDDGFGGHVNALYEQLDRLTPLLGK